MNRKRDWILKAEYWLEINTNNIPDWAQGHGGSLDDAYHIIKKQWGAFYL